MNENEENNKIKIEVNKRTKCLQQYVKLAPGSVNSYTNIRQSLYKLIKLNNYLNQSTTVKHKRYRHSALSIIISIEASMSDIRNKLAKNYRKLFDRDTDDDLIPYCIQLKHSIINSVN
jgi:hypothetical protein